MMRSGSVARVVALVTLGAASGVFQSARAESEVWQREIEIRAERVLDGRQDFTVRLLPAESHRVDLIVFECIYRQTFPWVDMRGKQVTKIHEPVSFIYRRKDVKLVNDLDHYVSFRVPVGVDRLRRMFGAKVFRADGEVTVNRMKIEARKGAETIWKHELSVPGLYGAGVLYPKKTTGEEEETEAISPFSD